jgi:hypothetical protein
VLPGWLLEAVGNGGPRGMAIARRRVTGAGNRTRLMGCFGQFIRAVTTGRFRAPRTNLEIW